MGAGGGKQRSRGDMPSNWQDLILNAWDQLAPLSSQLMYQFQEALGTGGVGAQIPIVQRAEESQRRAYSQSMKDLEMNFAQSGLAGTPFAAAEKSRLGTEARSSIADVGPSMVQQFLAMIPGFVSGQTSSILGTVPSMREEKSKGWRGNVQYGGGS